MILGLVSDGAARIQAAEDMESVNVVLTQTKNEIYTIETLAGTVRESFRRPGKRPLTSWIIMWI